MAKSVGGSGLRQIQDGEARLRRIVTVAAIVWASFVTLSGPTLAAEKAAPTAFKAPRNSVGQPDLSGIWSNASLTRETRPPALGNRRAYTAEEVAKLESQAVQDVEEGNADIDPSTPAPKVGGETPAGTRPESAAAAGGVGGYDRGWLEPGSTVMRVAGEPRTSFVTTPNGQVPPRKGAPAGRGLRGMGSFDSYEYRSLGERCILSFGRNAGPPMFPNGFYNNNYQFVQTADSFVILVEMVHDTRIVRLNGSHRTDGIRPWMGDSIGHWEGDTLVVETTNIPSQQGYRGSWEHLTVTERFTRVGKSRVLYQFTFDDPTSWDSPWGGEYEFAPLGGAIYEYACHEGNYALPGILSGARYEEAEAAKAKAEAAEKSKTESSAAAALKTKPPKT